MIELTFVVSPIGFDFLASVIVSVFHLVTVGAWSLVGMGSVVLGDVPPAEIWAGNPARLLRKAFVEELTP